MRQLGLARAKTKEPKPTVERVSGGITLEQYQTLILPALADVPLPEIERATGLSNSTFSRVRRGLQIPNPKQWASLANIHGGLELIELSATARQATAESGVGT